MAMALMALAARWLDGSCLLVWPVGIFGALDASIFDVGGVFVVNSAKLLPLTLRLLY